jgi:hypothetical protein
MSTRNLLGGKGLPARRADITAINEPIVYKMQDPRRLSSLWVSTACYRDSFTLFYLLLYLNKDSIPFVAFTRYKVSQICMAMEERRIVQRIPLVEFKKHSSWCGTGSYLHRIRIEMFQLSK